MADQDWIDDPTFKEGDGDWVDIPDEPQQGLGEKIVRGAANSLPIIGGLAGGVIGGAAGGTAGSIVPFAGTAAGAASGGAIGAGLGAGAGESAKNIIERYLLGDDKSGTNPAVDAAIAVKDGAMYEMGGQAVAKGLELAKPYIAGKMDALGKKLGTVAEKFAENATGATGRQAEKFSDDAGRELLDRGLIRFGDNAENIANRTAAELGKSTAVIDDSLRALDAKGVTASADNVVTRLEQKISQLKSDPSQADVVRKLEGIVEDIIQTGNSNVPISQAEVTKRGFNKMAGNWQDPIKGQAGKEAYLGYMDEVERAANAAEPAIASKFKEAKDTFGLLRPIQEAAERRASTLNQSPFGGLGDIASEAVAPGGSVLRRIASPRISSSAAVTLDKISKGLIKSPQMATLQKTNPTGFNNLVQMLGARAPQVEQSTLPRAADRESASIDSNSIIQKTSGSKYQNVLQNAADKGEDSFSAAHFVLSQRDPEYRKMLEEEGR